MRAGIIRPTITLPDFEYVSRSSHNATAAMDISASTKSDDDNDTVRCVLVLSASVATVVEAYCMCYCCLCCSEAAQLLFMAAGEAEDLSGRALRKLPFQAHAFYVQSRDTTPEAFMQALRSALASERESRQQLQAQPAVQN